jgi:hypothetical protein
VSNEYCFQTTKGKLMKKLSLSFFILILFLSMMPACPAYADAAPPMNPPGGNVSPEGQTEVSMLAETVVIDFRASTDDSAQVTAEFLFRNLGSQDEQLRVRFPLSGDPRLRSIDENSVELYYPLVTDFIAYVDNQQVTTSVVEDTYTGTEYFLGHPGTIYWSTFDAYFSVGQNVKIKVRYTLNPTDYGGGYIGVFYFLATGAGWKGPIGSADIIMRLPYRITPENFPVYNESSANSLNIIENEVQWHWKDLEPDANDNLDFTMIKPRLWWEVLHARSKIISEPENGALWANLGHAYYQAGTINKGFFADPQLNEWCIQAYEQALKLSPEDIAIHIDFTKVLLDEDPFPDEYPERWERILWEISYILDKDPDNQQAQELVDWVRNIKSGVVFPTPGGPMPAYVTPTPTRTYVAPILHPTNTIQPSKTPHPSLTPSPTSSLTATASAPAATSSAVISPTTTAPPQPVHSNRTTTYNVLTIIGAIIVGWLLGMMFTRKIGQGRK